MCYFHSGISPNILNVACKDRTKGRYVQIYKPTSDALTLCEVEVYSEEQENVASNKQKGNT